MAALLYTGVMSAAKPIATSTKLGRYQLVAALAKGGTGTVYLARVAGAEGFSRYVAVKRLLPHLLDEPELVTMLLDEARIGARLRHPGIIPVIDVVQGDGEVAIVQEYVHGLALSRFVSSHTEKRDPPPIGVTVAILSGVLSALHAAHEACDERGNPLAIVHRDVSPQNVLLGVDGLPRLIDFGIAKAITNENVTRAGHFRGKLAYMPPEQLRGEPVDRTADLYAVGVMLWELLEGTRRFERVSDAELLGHVLAGAYAPVSRPEAAPFAGVLARALALDPDARFQTADEMTDAIQAVAPAANARRVAEWMQTAAPRRLARLNEFLAAADASRGTIADEAYTESGSIPKRLRSRPPDGLDAEVPSVLGGSEVASDLSLSRVAEAPVAAKPNRSALVLGAALLLAIGAIIALVAGPRLNSRGATAASVGAGAEVPAAPTTVASAAVAPAAVAPAAATPAVAPGAAFHAPTPFHPAAHSPSPATTTSPATAATTSQPPSCNPPYYFENNTKKFKPECL
jgi:serine/threonine-protein kinase